MFKKILTLTLSLLLIFTLSACNNKYRVKREGMPDGLKVKFEKQIVTGGKDLTAATNNSEKVKALLEIGFAEQQLGHYDLAIPQYKKILTLKKDHYQSLNNLAVIYEDVGEYEKAAKLYGQLLDNNPNNIEALGDAIRMLITLKHFGDAQATLENFARAHPGPKYASLISDKFELIRNARSNANSN